MRHRLAGTLDYQRYIDRPVQMPLGRQHHTLKEREYTMYDSYIICTSPRSGSTLLCKLLGATAVAGNPRSYFHRGSIGDWLAYLKLDLDPSLPEIDHLEAIFAEALKQGRSQTDLFGLRLQGHSFEQFRDRLTLLHPAVATDRDRIEATIGRTLFIHLTRLDKVEQAISYVKAQQTGLWHKAPDGSELERLSAPTEPVYDAATICKAHDTFTGYDDAWKAWFADQNIDPLRLTYEALSADPIASLQQILLHLSLDPASAQYILPGTAKLADEMSRSWADRFLAELNTARNSA